MMFLWLLKSQMITASIPTVFLTVGRFTLRQNYRRLGAPSVTNVTLEQSDALDSQLWYRVLETYQIHFQLIAEAPDADFEDRILLKKTDKNQFYLLMRFIK